MKVQKTKQVGVTSSSDLSFTCTHLFTKSELIVIGLYAVLILFVCCHLSDEQLFSIMESICSLVDSIPEHELIALTCGDELLLKRAQRCVHQRNSFILIDM